MEGMGADANDAGMSEPITDGGMSEAITDGGMSDEASDSGTLDETTDAGATSASGGFSFHYGFEADDYAAPTNDPVTYNAGGDVWAAVSAVGPINEASEGTVFWGMQDLDNNENSGYHTLTFGPYDVSSFGGGTFSFDYFTIGYDASDKIGFALLLDDTNLPNLDVTDAALTMLNGDTVGEWTNQSGSFGASVTSVTLVIAATQNGGSDYAGVDNFLLTCDNCEAPTVTSCGAGATLTLPTTIADGVCTDCESGTYDDDADDSTACIAHTVTSGDCAAGQLFSEGTTTADGSCADIICEADQSVASNACEACAAGTSNEAGDSATGTDTDCDAVVCPANSEGTDVVSGCTCSDGVKRYYHCCH